MRMAIAALVVGMFPVAAMADHRYCDSPRHYGGGYGYYDSGYSTYGSGYGGYYDRPVYREYRAPRYDPPPVEADDLGDGRHYLDHHFYYDRCGNEYHYHHVHHYYDE